MVYSCNQIIVVARSLPPSNKQHQAAAVPTCLSVDQRADTSVEQQQQQRNAWPAHAAEPATWLAGRPATPSRVAHSRAAGAAPSAAGTRRRPPVPGLLTAAAGAPGTERPPVQTPAASADRPAGAAAAAGSSSTAPSDAQTRR